MMKKQESGKKIYRRVRGDSGQLRRMGITMALLGALAFVPVAIRLYDLMVVEYEQWSAKALSNQSRSTAITPERGVIYDRNMNILAASKTVENVYIDPRELHQTGMDIGAVSQALSEILEVDRDKVEKLANDQSKR